VPSPRPLHRFRCYVRALGLRRTGALLYGRWLRAGQPTRLALDATTTLALRPCSSDFLVFAEIFVDGAWDIPQLPRDPAVIVDCGANVGFASLFFARRWPRARILAIEPEPANFAALCANLRLVPNVTPIHAAIWPRDEPLTIADAKADPWAFQVRPWQNGEATVRGISFDTLIREHALESVDLLKIDVEGAERELFAAADLAWMEHVRTLAVELHESKAPGATAAFRAAIGRRPHRHQHHRGNEVVVFTG